MPGLRIRRKPPSTAHETVPGHGVRCRIPTMIKRATGTSERYALSSVRALPLRYRGGRRSTSDPAFRHNVVLQASDGHQAVCVLTEGAIEQPTLIPGEVLPTRHGDCAGGVAMDSGGWRSRDGKESPALDPDAEFPAISSVLPEAGPGTVAVAINVDRLRRVAASLGTDNVTLIVPPAKTKPAQPKAQATVTEPIGICPAGKDDTDGVAVMMPVVSDRSIAYYKRVRDAVVKAEQSDKGKTTRRTRKPKKEVAA